MTATFHDSGVILFLIQLWSLVEQRYLLSYQVLQAPSHQQDQLTPKNLPIFHRSWQYL